VAKPPGIPTLRRRASECTRCKLYRYATQVVFGEGPEAARIMVIGEQPGAREDEAGHPFVGPAGQLFDKALAEAGVERESLYVTNVMKHFKYERVGKVRLHKRANAAEQAACRLWLDAELARVKPARVLCLGSMAAKAILGAKFKLLAQRGEWLPTKFGFEAMATVHPSYLLRMPDRDESKRQYALFVKELAMLR
jgi:uracil-DNA glycosylase family protein